MSRGSGDAPGQGLVALPFMRPFVDHLAQETGAALHQQKAAKAHARSFARGHHPRALIWRRPCRTTLSPQALRRSAHDFMSRAARLFLWTLLYY